MLGLPVYGNKAELKEQTGLRTWSVWVEWHEACSACTSSIAQYTPLENWSKHCSAEIFPVSVYRSPQNFLNDLLKADFKFDIWEVVTRGPTHWTIPLVTPTNIIITINRLPVCSECFIKLFLNQVDVFWIVFLEDSIKSIFS